MRALLSPVSIVMFCWGLTAIGATFAIQSLDSLVIVNDIMQREQLYTTAYSPIAIFWLITAASVYFIADRAALIRRPRFKPAIPKPPPRPLNVNRAARLTFKVNLILIAVTAAWLMQSLSNFGGLNGLITVGLADSVGVRSVLLENTLFTGMRLFYAALPSTACLAAGLLATRKLKRKARRKMRFVLILNTTLLVVLPIILSQRLLLLMLVMSSYIAACLVRGRLFGLRWIVIGICFFLGLWTAREAITNPLYELPVWKVSSQKLIFYLANDMWNATAPIAQQIPHTLGGISLEGLKHITFTTEFFGSALEERHLILDDFKGGGKFPLFTAAYVDFGPYGGAVFVAFIAYFLRVFYTRTKGSFGWSILYAQTGAALVLSSHSVYFLHQNVLFSMMLIALILRLTRHPIRFFERPRHIQWAQGPWQAIR